MKRFLSLLLVAAMLTGMFPAWAVEGDSPESGVTLSEGATHTVTNTDDLYALYTSDAVQDGDIIVIRETADINEISGNAPWVMNKSVTIQGGTLNLRPGGILLAADVTFDGVTLAFANRVRNAIMANGHILTLKDVKQDTSTNTVHLFCGGLTGYDVSAPAGTHGKIIIQGSTSLGNVYAGSISADGAANDFALPASIIVDSTATGTMGELYACGALETPIPDDEMLNPDYVVAPPTANVSAFTVSGDVTLELYQFLFKTVDGSTGGDKNAAVTFNGNGYLCSPALTNLSGLSVESGNLQPTSGSIRGNVSISTNARLNVENFGDALTIADFSGGGELVLGENQTLTITGTVSGETSVEISGTSIDNEHTYIVAANSTDSSFILLPSQNHPDAVFVRDEDGSWTIPATEAEQVIVESASVEDAITEESGITFVSIPVAITFQSDPDYSYLSEVPVEISINDEVIEMTYGDYGYEYTFSEDSSFSLGYFLPDGDTELLNLDGVDTIPDGEYNITITIPAEYMADGEDLTLTTVLTVGEGEIKEPIEPERPEIIASGTCGENLTWELDEDGTLTISGTGAMTEYEWGEHPWDTHRASIINVVIDKGVTSICSFAFVDCPNLESAAIPDGLISIGNGAFERCTSLNGIVIPASVSQIAGSAFISCASLSDFSVNAGSLHYCVDDGVLYSKDKTILVSYIPVTGRTSLTIPASVTEIADDAFCEVRTLATVSFAGTRVQWNAITVGDNNDTLFDAEFIFAGGIASGTCGENLTWELDEDGTLTISGTGEMFDYAYGDLAPWFDYKSNITSVVICDNVTSIGDWAFYLLMLTDITFPDSVKTIGANAFQNCMSLAEITIPDTITEIGSYAFYDCDALKKVVIGRGITEISDSAFYSCGALNTLVIPDNIVSIGELAFSWCTGLTNITWGNRLSSIGIGAFAQCTSLNTVAIPGSVHSIGSSAFSSCTALTSVTLLDGVTSIGDYAFEDCTALSEITIPVSVTGIGGNPFCGCENLSTIYYNGSKSQWNAIENVQDNPYLQDVEIVCAIILKAPVMTAANDAATGKIKLSWNTVEKAKQYEIWYSTSKNGPYTQLWIGTGTTFTHSDAVPGQSYYYKIRAVAGDSVSEFGSILLRTCDLARPVITVTNRATDGKPVIKWEKVPGADKYYVYRATSQNGTYSKIYTTTSTQCINVSTDPGVIYYYKVMAIYAANSGGNSAYSAVVSRACDLPQPVITVTNRASDGKPVITWEKVPGADRYYVYRATSANGTYSRISTTTATTCTNTKAVSGEKYYYKVVAVYDANSGGNSAASAVVFRVCDLPQPVITVTNRASDGKPVITWDAVPGADKYSVYRATSQNGNYTWISTTTATSCTNIKAVTGVKYFYKVVAIYADNTAANSAYSAVKSRVCDLPQPVITVSNRASDGKPVITWEKVPGADKYSVYRATSQNGTYSKIYTTTGTQCINVSTETGVKYYYKVMAICTANSGANSAYSAVVSRVCDLPQPLITVTNRASDGKPVVKWEKVPGADKYYVYRATSANGTYSRISITTVTTCTNVKAVTGVKYYYKVIAVYAANSAANSAASAVVSRVCDLARPVITVELNSKGKPVIRWDAVEGAAKYEIWRSTSPDGTFTKIWSGTKCSVTNNSTESGVTYYYKVRAIYSNSAGNSAYSSIKSVTTE